MAQQVVIGNEVFKRRTPIAASLGLPIITLGVYFFVWYYKINNEARRYLRDPSIRPGISLLAVTLGIFIIVPPFISIYRTAERVRRMQTNAQIPDRCEPWIALVLALVPAFVIRFFFFSLDTLYLQIQLNTVWDAYLRPGMGPPSYPPPLPPPPPPAVPPAIPPAAP